MRARGEERRGEEIHAPLHHGDLCGVSHECAHHLAREGVHHHDVVAASVREEVLVAPGNLDGDWGGEEERVSENHS